MGVKFSISSNNADSNNIMLPFTYCIENKILCFLFFFMLYIDKDGPIQWGGIGYSFNVITFVILID